MSFPAAAVDVLLQWTRPRDFDLIVVKSPHTEHHMYDAWVDANFNVDVAGIIALITDPSTVRDIPAHIGEPITPPTVTPARGPPLWEIPPTGQREIDPQAQPVPDYQFDQRVAW